MKSSTSSVADTRKDLIGHSLAVLSTLLGDKMLSNGEEMSSALLEPTTLAEQVLQMSIYAAKTVRGYMLLDAIVSIIMVYQTPRVISNFLRNAFSTNSLFQSKFVFPVSHFVRRKHNNFEEPNESLNDQIRLFEDEDSDDKVSVDELSCIFEGDEDAADTDRDE